MTTVIFDTSQVKSPSLEKVISYLKRNGWEQISHPNQNLLVFQGSTDDLGEPIQLVLPQSTQLRDSSTLINKAINLIAIIEEKTPEKIKKIIELSGDNSSVSFESAFNQLIGEALVQKVEKLSSHLTKKEIAKQSGYYTITKNNRTRVNLAGFYNALLEAKGIPLAPEKLKDGRSRNLDNRVTVNENAQIVISASYTRSIGFKPGDEIEFRIMSKQIILSRVEST